MEWIEVFVSTSQMGLEPVEAVLYECGLTGLMIHDTSDFAEFLENPHRDWDYVADELVEERTISTIQSVIAAKEYAAANGIALTEEEKAAIEVMPYIVVLIDELADLIKDDKRPIFVAVDDRIPEGNSIEGGDKNANVSFLRQGI